MMNSGLNLRRAGIAFEDRDVGGRTTTAWKWHVQGVAQGVGPADLIDVARIWRIKALLVD